MKLSLLLIMSVVAASFAVTVDDLAAQLDKVEEQLAARLEAEENRIFTAKAVAGVPPGDDGSEADVSRRLQSSSSRATSRTTARTSSWVAAATCRLTERSTCLDTS